MPGQTSRIRRSDHHSVSAFNGGPGTCPAKLRRIRRDGRWTVRLQWRAGHVPGQTRGGERHVAAHRVPSMEGRARARPNDGSGKSTAALAEALQWRAGHVPGQTRGHL